MEESEKPVEGTRDKAQGTSQGSRFKGQGSRKREEPRIKEITNHKSQISSKSQIANKFQITIPNGMGNSNV
jgi:hypothetical protein